MGWFNCYKNESSDEECTLIEINQAIAIIKKQLDLLEKDRNERKDRIAKYKNSTETIDIEQEKTLLKRLNECIKRVNVQLNILEMNRLVILEDENNKFICNIIKRIGKEHKNSVIALDNMEKIIEKNNEVIEEKKEFSDIIEASFIESLDVVYTDVFDEFKDKNVKKETRMEDGDATSKNKDKIKE